MGTLRSKERITKPCDHCGEPVTRLKSADAPRFYCNKQCYWASDSRANHARALNRSRFPEGKTPVPCLECGKQTMRTASKVGKTNFCSRDCMYAYRRGEGKSFINSYGYIVVGTPIDYPGARANGSRSGQILEHRKVMQDMLGRPLLDSENVHHINGVRTDNRPENLELWSRSQPAGQRVEDKVAWARAILEQYGDLYPTAKTEL